MAIKTLIASNCLIYLSSKWLSQYMNTKCACCRLTVSTNSSA